jgi:uncharacterized membrane protein YhaH (DUF805 family)
MLKVYFAEFTNGRLSRIQYLGYAVFLVALMLAIGIGLGATAGIAEHMMGGELQEAQSKLANKYGGIVTVLVMLLFLLLLVAKLNIMAKRIRDIGLSGWWLVLAVVVLAGLASQLHTEQTGGAVIGLASLLLMLIPGGTFDKNS